MYLSVSPRALRYSRNCLMNLRSSFKACLRVGGKSSGRYVVGRHEVCSKQHFKPSVCSFEVQRLACCGSCAGLCCADMFGVTGRGWRADGSPRKRTRSNDFLSFLHNIAPYKRYCVIFRCTENMRISPYSSNVRDFSRTSFVVVCSCQAIVLNCGTVSGVLPFSPNAVCTSSNACCARVLL